MQSRASTSARDGRPIVQFVITGLAHSGICVPDCEAAVAFYRDVLGMQVLSPPYVMAGDAIRDDMGELVSDPTMKAAIVGFNDDSDRVLEVIEYLGADDYFIAQSDTLVFQGRPNTEVRLVEDTGHCAMSKAREVVPQIIAWLAAHVAA